MSRADSLPHEEATRAQRGGEMFAGDRGVPAKNLAEGECGLICHIEGDHEDMERLKTMGVCLGRRLHVVKPGDPMIVSVMGTRLGIAERLLGRVFLHPDEDPRCLERHRSR